MLTFTELHPHIKATYPDRSPAFHFFATRLYIGAETEASLQQLTEPRFAYKEQTLRPQLTYGDVLTMVQNR